jgi:hypothetical protein
LTIVLSGRAGTSVSLNVADRRGYHDGPDYLVMEYVEGKPLRLEEAIKLALNCGSAPRSVRPRHSASRPQARDFGLAKLMTEAEFRGHAPDHAVIQELSTSLTPRGTMIPPPRALGFLRAVRGNKQGDFGRLMAG